MYFILAVRWILIILNGLLFIKYLMFSDLKYASLEALLCLSKVAHCSERISCNRKSLLNKLRAILLLTKCALSVKEVYWMILQRFYRYIYIYTVENTLAERNKERGCQTVMEKYFFLCRLFNLHLTHLHT